MFQEERKLLDRLINQERVLLTLFGGVAIAGTLTPIFFPQNLSLFEKNLFQISGIIGAGGFAYGCHARQRKEEIYSGIDKIQLDLLRSQVKHAVTQELLVGQMDSLRHMAKIVQQLPPAERLRFMHQFGLQGLVSMPAPPAPPPASNTPTEIEVADQSPNSDMASLLQIDIDSSWLNEKFLLQSKGVFGAKGSGKSTYLSYEGIRFLEICPQGELRIVDLHYDEDESVWLPGIPSNVLLDKYLVNRPDKGLEAFRYAYTLLLDRIDRGDRKAKPFKLICDEFIGLMTRLNSEQQEEVLLAIQTSQFEGRKYGVNITLGLHSIKKDLIGVDSSVLANMDLMFLGNAIADPNLKLPSDFDAKDLIRRQQSTQLALPKGKGYACIVRKLGDAPQIEVMPHINLRNYRISIGDSVTKPQPKNEQERTDYLAAIKQWMQDNPGVDSNQIRQKWQQLTGQELTDNALNYLLNLIRGQSDD